MSEKKTVFRLSPELADGCAWTVVESREDVLKQVGAWLTEMAQYGGSGEQCVVQVAEMTKAELEALPEI